MKVRELIQVLQQSDPEAEVVTAGSDHSYDRVRSATQATGGCIANRQYFEWYGPENANPGEVPVPVVVLG